MRTLRARADVEDPSEDDHGSSSSLSSSDSDRPRGLDKIRQLRKEASQLNRKRGAFYSQCALALSVGFWVAFFGLPMYNFGAYRLLFGYRGPILENAADSLQEKNLTVEDVQVHDKLRISCAPQSTGRMRNIAPVFKPTQLVDWEEWMGPWDERNNTNDIWCGLINNNYLANWPNVASLIIFTVYKNSGTTVNYAWQGVVGTFFAWINMVFMQWLYPLGAKGHVCYPGTAVWGWLYTTLVHRDGKWEWKLAHSRSEAQYQYEQMALGGGIDARAIVNGDGKLVRGASWFYSPQLRDNLTKAFLDIRGEDCEANTMVYDMPGYNRWVCLADTLIVLFLFLISRASRNTIMFGMSWHVSFMMEFMTPSAGAEACYPMTLWGTLTCASEYRAVFFTTIIGVLVAVVATGTITFFLPLSHFTNLYDDSLDMTRSVNEIWRHALTYLSGAAPSAKRFQIETMISNLSINFNEAQTNAAGAWWETFDCGRWGTTRQLLQEYDLATVDIRDLMTCVRGCVMKEDFTGGHQLFMRRMEGPLAELHTEGQELMFYILSACRDGQITKEESAAIYNLINKVKDTQKEVVQTLHQASPGVTMDLAEENIFAFALSFWARKMTDFGESVAKKGTEDTIRHHIVGNLLSGMWSGFVDTWSPKRMFEREHVKFCIRNWLPISFAFCFSYFFPTESVFVQYSPVMASTLTLLIVSDGTHEIGSMIMKNTQRLLGVVLGKVLPILVSAAVLHLRCVSKTRFMIQAVTVWIYVFMFTYIYYASNMWGYVGCLVAGFGVYQLLVPCTEAVDATFQKGYQEIGAVVFAIVVQMVIQQALQRHTPTELQQNELRILKCELTKGFQAFFDADLQGMQAASIAAETSLNKCRSLLPECDPKIKPVSCGTREFKYVLCARVLRSLEHVYGELNLLIVAAKRWVANECSRSEGDATEDGDSIEQGRTGFFEVLGRAPALVPLKEDLMSALTTTLDFFQGIIDGTDSPEDVEALTVKVQLQEAPALYSELSGLHLRRIDNGELTNDLCVCLTIAARALENTNHHLFSIAEKCLTDFQV